MENFSINTPMTFGAIQLLKLKQSTIFSAILKNIGTALLHCNISVHVGMIQVLEDLSWRIRIQGN